MHQPIVLTCAAAPPSAALRSPRWPTSSVCGDDAVDLAAARAALEERGLTRIAAEGGPTACSPHRLPRVWRTSCA